MKKLFVILFLVGIVNIYGQDTNRLTVEEKSGKPMLFGFCTREAFQDTNFSWWFNSEYNNYEVDSISLEGLKAVANDYSVLIFMGTWCSDSRREVPRLFKIFDWLGMSEKSIAIFCVGRDKIVGDDVVDDMEIELVPTLIFYHQGDEIGRIIEVPDESLEIDMKEIILGDD